MAYLEINVCTINTNLNKCYTIRFWQEVSTNYYCTTLISPTTHVIIPIQIQYQISFALPPTHPSTTIRLLTMIHIYFPRANSMGVITCTN